MNHAPTYNEQDVQNFLQTCGLDFRIPKVDEALILTFGTRGTITIICLDSDKFTAKIELKP